MKASDAIPPIRDPSKPRWPTLVVYYDPKGVAKQRWRWRVVAANHRVIVASSEGFKTRAGAWANARLVRWTLADLVP